MHSLRWHYGLACCAAPTLLLGTAALAQAPSRPKTPLEEIIVTATMIERTLDRTPAAVSVVGEDDIQLGAPAARARRSAEPRAGPVHAEPLQLRAGPARVDPRLRRARAVRHSRHQGARRRHSRDAARRPGLRRQHRSRRDEPDRGHPRPELVAVRQRIGRRHQPDLRRRAAPSRTRRCAWRPAATASRRRRSRPAARPSASTTSSACRIRSSTAIARRARTRTSCSRAASTSTSASDRSLLTVVNFTDQPVSDDPGGLTAAVAPVEPALGGTAERAVRRRRVARADAARLRLHDAGRRARHDHGAQLLRVARFRQPAADAEPGHRRPRAPVRRRRLQLQLRRLLARSPEPLHRGRRLRRSRRRSPAATTTSTACKGRSASTRTST